MLKDNILLLSSSTLRQLIEGVVDKSMHLFTAEALPPLLVSFELPQYVSDAMAMFSNITENTHPEMWGAEYIDDTDWSMGRLVCARDSRIFPLPSLTSVVDERPSYQVVNRKANNLLKEKGFLPRQPQERR